MELEVRHKKAGDEANLIPLINIVFLILIFFLIATIIRPFSAKDIELANAKGDEELTKLSQSISIDKSGVITIDGKTTTVETLASLLNSPEEEAELKIIDVIADKALPADKLLEIVSKIPVGNSTKIRLLIERSGP